MSCPPKVDWAPTPMTGWNNTVNVLVWIGFYNGFARFALLLNDSVYSTTVQARSCDRMSSCLFVSLSVTVWRCRWWIVNYCDHISWINLGNCTDNKAPTPSLFVAQKTIRLIPGKHGENLGRWEVEWRKWRAGAQKRLNSRTRVKIEEKLLWLRVAIGTHQRCFERSV